MEILKVHKVAGGEIAYASHISAATRTKMTLSVFTPPGEGPFPVLIWLSGLTCTEENFTTKAGAYHSAAEHGVMIVAPDTSPRGRDLDGAEVSDHPDYDLGQGAGFYVDATESPWSRHFRMESYVVQDLLSELRSLRVDLTRIGVSGHSMGGHGALTLALKHPNIFRSVSAFAPISNPSATPWGRKAFLAYLGSEEEIWRNHDAATLVEDGAAHGKYDSILIDQGDADVFLAEQLDPQAFRDACARAGQHLTYRIQQGYDHSYFFVSTFIADHIAWHAQRFLS